VCYADFLFYYTKEDIRIRKSKKVRQYSDQRKKDMWTHNDVQNTIQKTKD